MVDCSRYFGTRIFHYVVVVVESYEYPNFALKYGNSRFPTALGSYPEYLLYPTVLVPPFCPLWVPNENRDGNRWNFRWMGLISVVTVMLSGVLSYEV